jgi:ATP-dependent exoDNAse (exonuclease V) alpha subunit
MDLNGVVQKALRQAGHIEEQEHKVEVLVNRQELTSEAKQHAFSFEAGDVIQFRKSNKALGVKAREYARVDAIDRKANEITVTTGGKAAVCRPRDLRGVQVYAKTERSFSVGDRIQFTSGWRQKRIDNRDMGHITYLDDAGNVRVKLFGKAHRDESGVIITGKERTVSFNVKEMPHFDLGYAVTSYSMQSAAMDTVLVNVAALDTRTRKLVDAIFANVTVSRSKIECEIYCDSKEELAPTLNRLHLKPKAHSYQQIREYALVHAHRVAV